MTPADAGKLRAMALVRVIAAQDDDHPDDIKLLVGKVGIIVGTGRMFIEDYPASYDCVVDVDGYGEYCAYAWQLEPAIRRPDELRALIAEIEETK
jgi:hypothetical protein